MTERSEEIVEGDTAVDAGAGEPASETAGERADREADGGSRPQDAEARAGGPGGDETPGHVDEVAPPEEEELAPEDELEALRDRHLRLAAEFENYRKRTRRELLEAGEAASAELARRLLDIVDDLQRVADAPCDPEQHEAMHEGVGLIARKLVKTLSDVGMEPVNPLGKPFDPNYHEAVLLQPTEDPEADELVSQVLKIGYRIDDRLLRPAQVAVYRYEEEDE